MVLKGVGAVKIIPKAIGMFIAMKEENLNGHGMYSPVSGCIAVEITV